MRNSEIVKRYIPLVDFIADIMGDECEVVLHDLTNPDMSVVKIRNGHWSGRKIGSSVTDLALKVLHDEKLSENNDYLTNYKAMNSSGNTFRSSSYFIKGNKGEIVGILCVNMNVDTLTKFKDFLERFTVTSPLNFTDDSSSSENSTSEKESITIPLEKLQGSVEEVIKSAIAISEEKVHVPISRMTHEEKIEMIRDLYDNGVFLLKGAVSEVAKHLDVSEPTIYRYIRKVK
jgi:predicted transcriptional regulator YheO